MRKPLSYYLDLLKKAWNDVPESIPSYPEKTEKPIKEPEKKVCYFKVHFIDSDIVDYHEINVN